MSEFDFDVGGLAIQMLLMNERPSFRMCVERHGKWSHRYTLIDFLENSLATLSFSRTLVLEQYSQPF